MHAIMDIVNADIERYLRGLLHEENDTLKEMHDLGDKSHFPIVGPLVGRLLFVLAQSLGAKTVFELGSGFGYSAYWFLQGLAEGGSIVLTDMEKANLNRAQAFLEPHAQGKKVIIEKGDAVSVIEKYAGPFDIIFMDIDKEQYPEGFTKAFPKLRKGGLFICDNVLWSGKVLKDDASPDTQGIKKFTEMIFSHPSLVTTIIPLRDGVSVSVKL